jgi:hypothetical protein
MQANAEQDPFSFRTFPIRAAHGLLEFNRRRQRIDCAGEFDQGAVAGEFDQPASVSRKCRL